MEIINPKTISENATENMRVEEPAGMMVFVVVTMLIMTLSISVKIVKIFKFKDFLHRFDVIAIVPKPNNFVIRIVIRKISEAFMVEFFTKLTTSSISHSLPQCA